MRKPSRRERKKKNMEDHEFRQRYARYLKYHKNDPDELYYEAMHFSKANNRAI